VFVAAPWFLCFSLTDGHFATIEQPDGVAIQGMAVNREGVIAGDKVKVRLTRSGSP
jgi:hypothetical protein